MQADAPVAMGGIKLNQIKPQSFAQSAADEKDDDEVAEIQALQTQVQESEEQTFYQTGKMPKWLEKYSLIQLSDNFSGYKPYDNVDGTMVPSPITYPGDPHATAAIARYETQHQRFYYNNVSALEPNYGPKMGDEEKRDH